MRLLKTYSHTSNGLAMEPGTHEEKQLQKQKRRPYNKAKVIHKNLPRAAGVAGGSAKGSRTCRISPVWRGGAGNVLRRTNHRKVL